MLATRYLRKRPTPTINGRPIQNIMGVAKIKDNLFRVIIEMGSSGRTLNWRTSRSQTIRTKMTRATGMTKEVFCRRLARAASFSAFLVLLLVTGLMSWPAWGSFLGVSLELIVVRSV